MKIYTYKGKKNLCGEQIRLQRLKKHMTQNDLAAKGPVRVYVRIKGPDGILLTNSSQRTFEVNGEPMICSASREVDYQGKEVELSIYLNDIPEYVKGIYTVEAYTEQSKLGEAEMMLR